MPAAAHRSSTRRVVRAVALGLAAAATALIAQPASPAAARALTGVDLSTYHRTARLDLPASTGANQLASEASAVTYDWDTDSLFVVGDEGTAVVRVDKDTGALIDSMPVAAGAFEDTEGIAYAGNGKLVITEERLRQVDRFTYVAGTTLTRADVQSAKLGTTVGNIGLEGVTYDRVADDYILAKETTPESIFETTIDWAAGTAGNGSPTTDESTDLFAPSLAGLNDFSDVYALSDVTGLTGPDADHLLMISQESGKIINISRAGVVASALTIRGDADNPLTVPDQTMEGVTLGPDGTLYVVNEQGGGVGHPQLWEYQPSSTPNAAPTGVAVADATTTLPDTTSTTDRVKVADLTVTDDDLGTNAFGVNGPDAAAFEADGTGLYLKAGTALDASAKSSYEVSVTVDDTTVGATPDATSTPYTLTVTPGDVGGPVTLAITEVDPTGSSATYAADWFELTNTGTTTADLTGFKIDDDTGGAGAAVPMVGVTSLAPGASAVFVEGTAATATAFTAAWFGGHPPAGLQVGSYTGSGVGLGSGGDQVNVFDGTGAAVTGVAFGQSTPGVSFDNAAGIGDTTTPPPTIATLSAVGVHGAFTAGGETGSPGRVNYPLTITEVNPTGNDNGTYGADWFEITNNGTLPVDLSGFKMDDNSGGAGAAVPMVGVASIAPGESVVYTEGTATTATALKAAWFGPDAPADVRVGSYTGSGVGLGAGGDQVNVYDVGGNAVTGVAFGQSTPGVTFDNSAGLGGAVGTPPTVTTLSVVGVDGARVAGGETGSPATIAPDVTAPVVTYGGNAGTYTVGDTVRITCAAADEAYGSGLDTTDCVDVDAPASTFAIGQNTITTTATDHAGNVGTASVTFTVKAAAPPIVESPGDPPPPAVTPPAVIPPAVVPPAVIPPAPAPAPATPATPKAAAPTSAKAASLRKGVTTTLTHLKARSKVTLSVRAGGRTVTTIKVTADAQGTGKVKLKLTRKQLAKLHGKTLTLRYTVLGADGKPRTLTTTLKVK